MCAVLGVLKIIVVECDGLYWLLEERVHILVLNQLSTSSYFVARMAEEVIHQILVTCVENVFEEKAGLKELCKTCLDDLGDHLNIEEVVKNAQQSNTVSFTTIIRLASHTLSTSLPAEVIQYLFTISGHLVIGGVG